MEMEQQKEQKLYKQKVVRAVTGLGSPLMSTWLKAGFIVPDYNPARRGLHAGYSINNMVQLRVMDMLAEAGVSLKTASRIAKTIANISAPVWYNLQTDEHLIGLKAPNVPDPKPPADWTIFITINVSNVWEGIQQKLDSL